MTRSNIILALRWIIDESQKPDNHLSVALNIESIDFIFQF